MLKYLHIIVLIAIPSLLYSQAGKDTYQFLNLPSSSRVAAYGGAITSVRDGDLSLSLQNPALLSEKTHNSMSLNFTTYLAGINYGSAIYSRNWGKNYFALGIHYIDYGNFLHTSAEDLVLGTFTAKDFAFNLIYARELGKGFTVGGILKPIYSVYERYQSAGIAMDLGAHYDNPEKGISVGLVMRNIGFQFSGYYSIDGEQHRESLPFDIQMGFTYTIPKAPLRFTMTVHNMQRFNLDYDNSSLSTYGIDVETPSFIDMAFRHTIFTAEIIPKSQAFYIMASYNHRRAAELSVNNYKSAVGFSFGAGFKVSGIRIGAALTPYLGNQMAWHFTVGAGLNEFGVKDKKKTKVKTSTVSN